MQIHYSTRSFFPSTYRTGVSENWFSSLYPSYFCEQVKFQPEFSYHYFNFFSTKRHVLHTSYQEDLVKVVICLAGQSDNRFSDRVYSFLPGQILIYRTQQSIGESLLLPDTFYQLIHLHFPIARLQALAENVALLKEMLQAYTVVGIPIDVRLQPFINAFIHSQNTGAFRQMQFESLSLQLLLAIVTTSLPAQVITSSPSITQALYKAKAILEETPGFITIKELSKAVGINECHLKKGFKATFQSTIFSYQQENKLTRAWHLLQHSTYSVQEVAGMCGYQSLGSFSDAFMRRYNFRPSDTR